MNSVSPSNLEAAAGGLLDIGIAVGSEATFLFVDLGLVFNLPHIGSLRFGDNMHIVHQVW